MSETITNEDLINLQRKITKALQEQVLSNLGGNYKFYLEALGFSIRLQDRLASSDLAKELQYAHAEISHIREY